MLSMSRIEIIRQKYRLGVPITQICREENVDFKTAKKWINATDFSQRLPVKKEKPKVIDKYAKEITELLEDNKDNWHKQQLTAKRVYDLLCEAHTDFDISYTSVLRFVQKWKRNQIQAATLGFSHLTWYPGEAQADFGEADFYYGGVKMRFKYFILSFPYSNKAYAQIFRGENCECVCQALINIFNYLKLVPKVIVFDNATGIGRRICSKLEENEMFTRFRLQYGFESRFCNPNAGHEKGNVEANVGYVRRNLFTPLIKLPADVEEFNNTKLFEMCENLMSKRKHYIHQVMVNELFENDKKAMYPLPESEFKARRILTLKTNNYANVILDKIHSYTLDPEYMNKPVLVETWAWKVCVYDVSGKLIEEFEREYSQEHTESISAKTSVNALVRKPGSWSNSSFRNGLSEENPFRIYVDKLKEANQKKEIFKNMQKALDDYDYETVITAFSELSDRKIDMSQECNVSAFCARVDAGTLNYSTNTTGVDLNMYSYLINGEQYDNR